VLLAACSKKSGDKCQRVIEKSMTVLGEMAALRGAKLGDEEKQQLVAQCQKAVKAGHPDPQIDCVLAAADDAGVRKCYIKGYEDYLERSKEVEAKLQLLTIGKRASAVFDEKAEFPKGKVGPTPATPCCAEPTKQCTPTDTMWSDPVWQALDFRVQGTFLFHYTYESDGKTFTATATGDVGCTGKPTTTTLTGKVGADGKPELSKL
jgi:hypothetical protein